ncbi:hypothetical protein LEP1GSC043_2051 [Leptospira weilii str. Ecochallenge]|uniref:SNARE-like domain protein n=1 Tax=Leptospira weilii str. Ecochallenge TaxID=1049986 RepID=N1U7T4_9LEPT|nr:hypothetical protein LEP1GSC043_2051 [Leptospira weilii str. Ecochallenge]
METLQFFIDLFLNLETHLDAIIQTYQNGTYVILFLIIFAETGLVVTPFLPGDSLLFAVGAFIARGSLDLGSTLILLIIAAILGDTVNYSVGNLTGEKILEKKNTNDQKGTFGKGASVLRGLRRKNDHHRKIYSNYTHFRAFRRRDRNDDLR